VYEAVGIPMVFRSSEQLRALFDDRWSWQSPGLAPVGAWESDRRGPLAFDARTGGTATYVGVARLRDTGAAS
jgi:hypothetical protein